MNQSLAYEIDEVMPQAVATGLFVSVATFYDRVGADTPVTDALGQVDLTQAPVVGLESITCMFAVEMIGKPDAGGGVRLQTNFEEKPERHLLLDSYYPSVLPRYTVNVDGTLYEITPGSVEHDSQNTQTRLAVRRFSF